MHTIFCLRQEILSGTNRFPVFVGFAPADVILQLASAPSFTGHTPHNDIANNILTPPIRDWQRPLDHGRVDGISRVYNDSGELMPNPVLLCENISQNGSGITIAQQRSSGIATNVWEVVVPEVAQGQDTPLWILDGQHRINGLAQSAQKANPLPVVLLLNQGQGIYQGPLVAKIFAQVTTAATPLDDLHNEWLTYAFTLGAYSSSNPSSEANCQSMRAVAELCRRPMVVNNAVSNPFFNRVRFNDKAAHLGAGPLPGGFKYTCTELKEIIKKYYYSCSAPFGSHLDHIALSDQMVLAFNALVRTVAAPQDKTVFFGSSDYEQRIMQDAFWAGALSAILVNGPAVNWDDLLLRLQFSSASWDFRSWTRTLSGRAQSISKALAIETFASAFRTMSIPTSSGNLSDFLKGNDASLELEFSSLSPQGRPVRAGRSAVSLRAGSNLSAKISPASHFRVRNKSGNIGKLEIIDAESPPGRLVYYNERGEPLNSSRHNRPLKLVLKMHHYGGLESSAQIELTW
jgi:hypothetical protein